MTALLEARKELFEKQQLPARIYELLVLLLLGKFRIVHLWGDEIWVLEQLPHLV
jgi:hypothetical protein